jgi:uncharacterized membrane protein YqjE
MFQTIDRLQELTGRLAEEVQTLIRLEIQLAQAEMAQKAKSAARAAIYGAIAGVLLFFAVFGFLIAAIWGLGEAVSIWLSALIVSLGFVLLAGIVGLIALRRAKRATPPYPADAIESIATLPEDLERAVH